MSLSRRCGCCQHENGRVVEERTFGEIGMTDNGRHRDFIMRKGFISGADVLFSKSNN